MGKSGEAFIAEQERTKVGVRDRSSDQLLKLKCFNCILFVISYYVTIEKTLSEHLLGAILFIHFLRFFFISFFESSQRKERNVSKCRIQQALISFYAW